MARKFRYDWYGALAGVGLPLVGTIIEAVTHLGSLAPAALLRAHLGQPLLWIMDTTPFVLGGLGRVIVRQHEELVRQSDELVRRSQEIVRLEQARRESFERTASELAHAAQALLADVRDITRTTTETAASVRATTTAIHQLSQAAAAAALTADDVIGLALRSERAGEEGLRQAEAADAGPSGLAEEVRGLSATLRDSARAAREIARVAQQQEGGIELALKAMNQIALATEETVTSTQHVAREARELEAMAASLRAATRA